MKKVVKMVQILVVSLMLGQYLPISVQAAEIMIEGKNETFLSPFYTYIADIDATVSNDLKEHLKMFEDQEYVVQKPIKLLSYTENHIQERY
ncbi:hypothetical protein I6N95_15390 [Vagococcus sp. BWB3-3]|uniref:Uncharacterized protein n=1 Tax=Vagococcus allomyrinae TaxID=2794353 RepID=A0A940SSV3_9ENTE|nr:hypothetical protein [Vagococcus allomyrinae]MBP1042402.1 hypothetical protein [Vagococcus allomyrinae]